MKLYSKFPKPFRWHLDMWLQAGTKLDEDLDEADEAYILRSRCQGDEIVLERAFDDRFVELEIWFNKLETERRLFNLFLLCSGRYLPKKWEAKLSAEHVDEKTWVMPYAIYSSYAGDCDFIDRAFLTSDELRHIMATIDKSGWWAGGAAVLECKKQCLLDTRTDVMSFTGRVTKTYVNS